MTLDCCCVYYFLGRITGAFYCINLLKKGAKNLLASLRPIITSFSIDFWIDLIFFKNYQNIFLLYIKKKSEVEF